MGVVKIDERRPPPQLCDYCGGASHSMPFMCPRITRITYHEDGDVTVSFTQGTSVLIVPDPDKAS